MAAGFEEYLYQNRFTRPLEFVAGIDDYFLQVANNDRLDCALRVKAAVELGSLNGLKASGRFFHGTQVHLAFEDALERYASRFPPRNEI
jgi:hypothetical protein